MATDELLSKIQKLLGMTQSSNENEAANAARLVRKLMIQHDLSMEDVLDSTSADPTSGIEEHLCGHAANNVLWKINLWSNTARFYLCRVVRKGHNEIRIVGKSENARTAIEMIWYLGQTMEKNLLDFKKKSSGKIDGVAYREGWISAVSEKFDAMAKVDNAEEGVGALIVKNDNALAEYMAENYGAARGVRVRSGSQDAASYAAGRTAGSQVSLNKQVR